MSIPSPAETSIGAQPDAPLGAPKRAPSGRPWPDGAPAAPPVAPAVVVPDFRALARRRAAREDVFHTAVWATTALAVSLYLAIGAVSDWSGFASGLIGVGIMAGLAGSHLVLVMLLLAARLPWVDRTIGLDAAMRIHATLGKPALYLILAHALLLVLGYGAALGLDPLAQIVSLWETPDFPLAFLALGLFLAVVGTSIVAVRRRMPYEFWFVVHLLSYGAVLAALPHQFSAGGVLAEGSLQRWYWMSLYALTLAALLVYRVALPAWTNLRAGARVRTVIPEGSGTWSVVVSGRGLGNLRARGGQYLRWRFLTPGLWWQQHPYSLSAEPHRVAKDGSGRNDDGLLRITVRGLGDGSAAIAGLAPGTRVLFSGPYGLFTEQARTRPGLVLVGAGTGTAPIRALLEGAAFPPGGCAVVLRASTPEDLLLRGEIAELCRLRGAALYEVVGHRAPGGSPESVWLPEAHSAAGHRLESFAPWLRNADVYVCGPAGWSASVAADARAAGVAPESLHLERFEP